MSVLVLRAVGLHPASTHCLLMPGLSHQGFFRMLWQVRVCYSLSSRSGTPATAVSVPLCVLSLSNSNASGVGREIGPHVSKPKEKLER